MAFDINLDEDRDILAHQIVQGRDWNFDGRPKAPNLLPAFRGWFHTKVINCRRPISVPHPSPDERDNFISRYFPSINSGYRLLWDAR